MLREQAGRCSHHAVSFISDNNDYRHLVFSCVARLHASVRSVQTRYERHVARRFPCTPASVTGAPERSHCLMQEQWTDDLSFWRVFTTEQKTSTFLGFPELGSTRRAEPRQAPPRTAPACTPDRAAPLPGRGTALGGGSGMGCVLRGKQENVSVRSQPSLAGDTVSSSRALNGSWVRTGGVEFAFSPRKV